jgi:general stress protein 26
VRRRLAVLALVLLPAASAPAQAPPASPADPALVRRAAREIAVAARFCTLSTVGTDSLLQARVMDVFPIGEDLVAWMGTHKGTRKVAELARDPRATLSCFDPAGPGYVTFAGRAERVTDAAALAQRFKPEWAPFYEGGAQSRDYLLLKLVPRRVEVVSHAHGLASGPRAWRPEILELP